MACCSRNIINTVNGRRRSNIMSERKNECGKDDVNEIITICNNKVSVVNILKKGNEQMKKIKGQNENFRKSIPSKANLLKYYEANFLKDKKNRNNNNNTLMANKNQKDRKRQINKLDEQDSNNEELIAKEVFSKLKTKEKLQVLDEVEKQLKEFMKDEKFNMHNDIIFLNIYSLTHKRIYSILNKKNNKEEYYSCNEILEMILKGDLHKNCFIKRKSDSQYFTLKEKISEIHFLKYLELQYYLKKQKKEHHMKSKLENNFDKENILYLKFSESLLGEKVKSIRNFLISPYDKDVVEIILIPKHKNFDKFSGYHKIVSNLFITKYISVYFYHIIEKKIEKYNLIKKNGPIYIKMKLKTNYPLAIQTIFRYIFDKTFKLHDLDFKLLVTVYIECIHFKIYSIINDITNAISEKANFNNIIQVLNMSSTFKETPIFNDFARIISDSAFYLFASDYHYLLHVEIYSFFLSLDNIMINEMRIFIESIKFIIVNNCHMKEQKDIFENIRFNLLNNEHIYEIQQYIKNCFKDIMHNKYDRSNFICMRYNKPKKKNDFDNIQNKSDNNLNEVSENKLVASANKEIPNIKKCNLSFLKEIKKLNKVYKNINNESFEPPNWNNAVKKEISNKKLTECMNNIYNILFDNLFKKILNKEIKHRYNIWNENKDFECVNNFTNENYSIQLIKRKSKEQKYAFTYGDERLINECKLFFEIIKCKNSNLSIGFILKSNELYNSKQQQDYSKISNILTECNDHLVIYFDFFVNDFYVCNINYKNSTLINKTKLNIYAHENKITDKNMIEYSISVINHTLNLDIKILPNNIRFNYSLSILKPKTLLGDIIKKPFINIKPFFMLKDSYDSICIPCIKFKKKN
ncbi:conserved Plasmodium protein, unknown function [Plasmodium sp. gorilla clade G3]|nr:conserved Plasmodium protein, unknown function [Plasmodium sp. gorilla clade G3]